MDLWPHQIRGVDETLAAIARGERRICLTSPTGGGKTRMACSLIERWLEEGLRTIIYTNRRMLVDQLSGVLDDHGIRHGLRAAGHGASPNSRVQVSSIQTENERVVKGGTWHLYEADRVLVDEAHLQTAEVAQQLMTAHHAHGAALVGLTATPLGLGGLYDTLIVAGTTSELRACGALVPARHYGCDEPDLRFIGRVPLGEDLTESQAVKAMMTPTIWARVVAEYKRLNPENRPTILFAPSVASSLWFAEQFWRAGISAAHIDGASVWVDGEAQRTSEGIRAQVLKGSKDGRIHVLCNRYVLREGIDAPWLSHGILATVFGSLQSYLQSGGRLLRACAGLAFVTIQDHGGNWWRHGSLNADRTWSLEYTPGIVSGLREDRLRGGDEKEPWRCPECEEIMLGPRCRCGFVLGVWRRSRPVVQLDGTLREMTGEIFKPRRITRNPAGLERWKRMYYRSKTDKGKRTFKAAAALFAEENNWGWPNPLWPLMPIEPIDWYRLVSDVPAERLRK